MKFLFMFMLLTFTSTLFALPTFTPQLVLKNQQGETSVNYIAPGTTFVSGKVSANTVVSNLTGATAYPIGNTYSAVAAKLPPQMLLTGFAAGAGTVSGTDTVFLGIEKLAGNTQNTTVISNALTGYTATGGTIVSTDTVLAAFQKLGGNVAAHQANSTAVDVAGIVADFNTLLANLQAANLMH